MKLKDDYKNPLTKIWSIFFPILLYYAISNVAMALLLLALQITEEAYLSNYIMLQTAATALCLPILYGTYRKDRLLCTVFQQRLQNAAMETPLKKKILNCALTFLIGALAGMALNQAITATGLMQISRGYQEVTAYFYGGGIFFEALGLGILIPVAEELLYRGIVYGRLADWAGVPAAMAWSAVIFGGLHMNLVQFLYAALLGLLLSYVLELTHSLAASVCAHMGANLLTLLRAEGGVFSWIPEDGAIYWGSTAAAAMLAATLVCALRRARLI